MQNVINLFEIDDKMCKIKKKKETNVYMFVRKFYKLKNLPHKGSFHAKNYSSSIVHSDALACFISTSGTPCMSEYAKL